MSWKRFHCGLSPFLFSNLSPPVGNLMPTLRFSTSEQGLRFFMRSFTSLRELDGLIERHEVVAKNPDIRRAVEGVLPSIVKLSIGGPELQNKTYNGIVVDSDGTIITSGSIDPELGAFDKLKVNVHLHPSFVSKECSYSGEFSLVDTHHNIAIVKCKSDNPLPAVKLRNRLNLDDGDKVITLGTIPMQHGEFPFKFAVQPGFVTSSKGLHSSSNMFKDYCFSCFPGFDSDDGVLVDRDGQLVGVGSCSRALSVELIYRMLKFSKKYKKPFTPWLGMLLKFYHGVCLVCKVMPKSPADRAGICVSDLIMDVDGHSFRDRLELYNYLYFKSGKPLKVTLDKLNAASKDVSLTPTGRLSFRFDGFI